MAFGAKVAPAATFFYAAFRGTEMERSVTRRAQFHLLGGNIHDEALRRRIFRKPRCPNLMEALWRKIRHCFGIIDEQITEPPRAAAVGQAATHEPHFIAAAHVGS